MTQMTVGGETYSVKYVEDLAPVWAELRAEKTKPKWCVYDVETDGLHIKKARPFLAALLYNDKVFVFPTNKATSNQLLYIVNYVGMLYNHNINYDMHMTANISEDDEWPLKVKRYGDTMGLCRLTFEAISERDGGDSLRLKAILDKYVDKDTSKYQKAVRKWLADKKSADRKILVALLRGQGWTMKRFEAAMNDGAEPIPDHIMSVFHAWRNEYPNPTYKDVPMDIMLPYVAVDVIGTNILVKKALPVVYYRKQEHIMNTEWDLLPHVYEMERQGIPVDRDYLMDAGEKMDTYIQVLQNRMHDLAGRTFNVGQHKVVKDIYEEKLGERPESTDKKFLKAQGDDDQLAKTIIMLRRLEKWKSTYIDHILEVSEYDGNFYTSMNQFNPVSGRFSGDAQQFPKDPILTAEGDRLKKEGKKVPESEVIYHPRRAFQMRGYYLDFSQVELRVQGHYTLYLGGDVNLCRAYMPFKCIHSVTGEEYDYKTMEGRARWSEMKPGAPEGVHWEDLLKAGHSVWTVPGTELAWIPTDVHTLTTVKALRTMGFVPEEMDPAEVKWWRNEKGKRFNFMRNYGGGDAKAAEVLDITIEQAKAMNKGYTDAFPMVIGYQDMVVNYMRKFGYCENMSGRRYYVSETWKHYKVANYLIQGSCADDLKKKMVKIARWIKENNLKMRMVLCVHDEIQFRVNDPAEDWAIPHIKAMMEDCTDIMVPIVAEVEFSDTFWSAKRKVLLAS